MFGRKLAIAGCHASMSPSTAFPMLGSSCTLIRGNQNVPWPSLSQSNGRAMDRREIGQLDDDSLTATLRPSSQAASIPQAMPHF